LTIEALQEHINGVATLGMYLFENGGSTVQVGVFDMDDHAGSTPWGVMVSKSDELMGKLEEHGLRPVRFRSRGVHGIHIWVLFDSSVDAAKKR
jgi:hypothetical protein